MKALVQLLKKRVTGKQEGDEDSRRDRADEEEVRRKDGLSLGCVEFWEKVPESACQELEDHQIAK